MLDSALQWPNYSSAGRRVVRYAPLDVHFDPALRIVQLVTSLQQGGAERVALDLHRTLGQYGVHSLLVGLGSPTRAAFPAPAEAVDVSRIGPGRPERIAAAARAALDFAADLVHGHLLHGADVAQLSRVRVARRVDRSQHAARLAEGSGEIAGWGSRPAGGLLASRGSGTAQGKHSHPRANRLERHRFRVVRAPAAIHCVHVAWPELPNTAENEPCRAGWQPTPRR